jgi:hypothetical protein
MAGSIYDAHQENKNPRYSIDGRVVEGTIIDSDGNDVGSDGTKRPPGLSLDDLLAKLRQAAGMLTAPGQGSRMSLAEALARSRQIQEIEAKFPAPSDAALEARRSGITRTPDPRDQARVDAAQANYQLAILDSRMMTLLIRYVVSGKQQVMDGMTQLITMDAAYPASVQPFGQLLTEYGIELLIEAYKQGGEQLAVFMLEEISRAATYRR